MHVALCTSTCTCTCECSQSGCTFFSDHLSVEVNINYICMYVYTYLHVCVCPALRRERHDIPLIVQTCVDEVERRGGRSMCAELSSFIAIHIDMNIHMIV